MYLLSLSPPGSTGPPGSWGSCTSGANYAGVWLNFLVILLFRDCSRDYGGYECIWVIFLVYQFLTWDFTSL